MNMIQQFLGGLGGVVPAAPASLAVQGRTRKMSVRAAAAPPPPLRGQMLMPATAWNWPDPVTGTATNAQFRFADTVPQSAADSALYQPSGRSFSQGYMTFLRVLATCKFPYPDLLASALQKIALPPGNPTSSPTPAGWTKVNDAGYDQWQPIWTLPQSSSAWMASVAAGTICNPGSLRLILNDASGAGLQAPAPLRALDADGHDMPLPAAPLDTVTITASCWDQVFIYPGNWYDASMLTLGRGLLPDASAFFGPAGLMACRVASFYVALQPRFSFTASTPIPDSLRQTLDEADTVQAMGVTVRRSPGDGAQGQALGLENVAPAPVIVAVRIEAFA